ncbi:hypothetical protein BN109_gp2 [Yersinia phage phi80-18]|uniref:Uncharacterized protein n=1 Tax=Yersinia phage phi80-18 TaxID=1206559 RepID=I7LET0_9CAUD|nr:hypothetical protein BN109_gp2 [Yersinia phage phi80-18]CCI88842.2 hypothetical protein [Yersinia phage phi80-18]
MNKNKRKINKQAIINGSRLYTVISNGAGYDGNVHHFFAMGTVVRNMGTTTLGCNEFVEVDTKCNNPLSQHLRLHHYQ